MKRRLAFHMFAALPLAALVRSSMQPTRVQAQTAGMILTVAGSGKSGFAGDGGPALAAQLNTPNDVVLDAPGNLFIADSSNNRSAG